MRAEGEAEDSGFWWWNGGYIYIQWNSECGEGDERPVRIWVFGTA